MIETNLQIVKNPNSDRATLLELVRRKPFLLEFACDAFKDDYDVVRASVDTDYADHAFMHASPRLRADRTIAGVSLMRDKYMQCISFVDPSLLSDREFIVDVISVRSYVFRHSTVPWTRDFLVDCLVANCDIMDYLPEEYRSDRQFALDAIARGGTVLFVLSDQLKDDREVVLQQFRAESEWSGYLAHVSPRLRCDREIVLEAVRANPLQLEEIRLYIEYTPEERERLLSDEEIVTAAVAKNGNEIRYAADACRTNRIVVMTALTSRSPTILRNVPSCLSSDPCIRLCVSANTQSTVDALLTVLETEVDISTVSHRDRIMYRHATERPFTADTVLSLLKVDAYDVERIASTSSVERLNAVATLVNEWPGEHVHSLLRTSISIGRDRLESILTDSTPPSPNKYASHGVCEMVADRLQRLGQISDALPYIDRTVRHNDLDVAFRNQCIARVDALAAKVHHPTGIYASLVHKRSYAEAFA